MTQLPEKIVPMTGKFVPGPLRIFATVTDGTIEQIAAGSGCTRLKTGVPVGFGGGAGLVAVGVTVLVAIGVDVDCLTVAVGKGVAVGSTIVRLQASGNKNARPRMNLCQIGSFDMIG